QGCNSEVAVRIDEIRLETARGAELVARLFRPPELLQRHAQVVAELRPLRVQGYCALEGIGRVLELIQRFMSESQAVPSVRIRRVTPNGFPGKLRGIHCSTTGARRWRITSIRAGRTEIKTTAISTR